jgi:hypothetical protein
MTARGSECSTLQSSANATASRPANSADPEAAPELERQCSVLAVHNIYLFESLSFSQLAAGLLGTHSFFVDAYLLHSSLRKSYRNGTVKDV